MSVGVGHANKKVPYEYPDGKVVDVSLSECITRLLGDCIVRPYLTHNLIFPEGIVFAYMPADRRYFRNVDRFRSFVQILIDERRKTTTNNEDDLLSILTTSEFFKADNDGMIIDEIFTFFLAGMKTIQVSTTNLIYYLTKHPEFKQKLLAEILPPLKESLDNLTYDRATEFDYLQCCFNESIRIEPPAPATSAQIFTQDTTLTHEGKKITFKKGTPFSILIEAIHHDPF